MRSVHRFFFPLVFIAAPLAAYAQVQEGTVESLGSYKTSRYLVIGREKGRSYQDCSRRMKGHESGSNQIHICLYGTGIYSVDAIEEIASQDWFSANQWIANQVDEIRIYCDFRDGLTHAEQIIFPIKTEASKGAKMRIEFLCENNAMSVRSHMRAYQKLISLTLTNPNLAVDRTNVVAEACDKNSHNESCNKWKNFIKTIFSSDATKPLRNGIRSCDARVGVGLEVDAFSLGSKGSTGPLANAGHLAIYRKCDQDNDEEQMKKCLKAASYTGGYSKATDEAGDMMVGQFQNGKEVGLWREQSPGGITLYEYTYEMGVIRTSKAYAPDEHGKTYVSHMERYNANSTITDTVCNKNGICESTDLCLNPDKTYSACGK